MVINCKVSRPNSKYSVNILLLLKIYFDQLHFTMVPMQKKMSGNANNYYFQNSKIPIS